MAPQDAGTVGQMATGEPVQSAPVPEPAPKKGFKDSRWFVLFLLFFVAGPFGLPMLWKGRAFGRTGKTVLTVFMLVMTVFAGWACYKSTVSTLNRMNEFQHGGGMFPQESEMPPSEMPPPMEGMEGMEGMFR